MCFYWGAHFRQQNKIESAICIIFDVLTHVWFIFEGLVLLPFGSHFAALEMKLSWLGTGPGPGGSWNRADQFDRAHSLGKIDEKSILRAAGPGPEGAQNAGYK